MAKQKRIAVITSGGDAPGMNAAIRSIVLAGLNQHYQIIGYYHGYNGIIDQESTILKADDVNSIIQRGGTILKSARCKAFYTTDGIKQAANSLIKDNIDALIVIGGDGSFTGALKLSQYWDGQIIGIPGTIDNDVDGTDHTIGFPTAINTALNAIDKIRDTADAFDRVFIVELMGRHSGHITFNVGLASAAEAVVSFENTDLTNPEATLQQIANQIHRVVAQKHRSFLIVIAENLWPGGTTAFAQQLSELSGIDCTPCILGYIQRGGSPVAKDRTLATKMGVAAIKAVTEHKHLIMIGEVENKIVHVPLTQAIEHHKTVDTSLIDAYTNLMTSHDADFSY
jgi:6-phosphofructokinase 1